MAATLTFGRRTSSHSCVIVLQLQLLMHLHTIRDAAFELSADNTALLFGLEDVLLMVSQKDLTFLLTTEPFPTLSQEKTITVLDQVHISLYYRV